MPPFPFVPTAQQPHAALAENWPGWQPNVPQHGDANQDVDDLMDTVNGALDIFLEIMVL
jgi:hypothetical protein